MGVMEDRPTTLRLKEFLVFVRFDRGGGGRTRPPNYKVPWNEGVAAARQIQLLILLTRAVFPAGCAGRREILGPPNVGSLIFKKEPATSPE